jgi:hypothetical protein
MAAPPLSWVGQTLSSVNPAISAVFWQLSSMLEWRTGGAEIEPVGNS